jgi:hypothetical protein
VHACTKRETPLPYTQLNVEEFETDAKLTTKQQ